MVSDTVQYLTVLFLFGMVVEDAQVNKMDKDNVIANTLTMGAVGMTVMSPIEILTIVSLMTAIGLNLILMWKNLKPSKKGQTSE
jgi:uncharacterized membrane protein